MSKEQRCIACNTFPGKHEVERGKACDLHVRLCEACGKPTSTATASILGYGRALCSRPECINELTNERERIRELYEFAKARVLKPPSPIQRSYPFIITYFLANLVWLAVTIVGVLAYIGIASVVPDVGGSEFSANSAMKYLIYQLTPTMLIFGVIAFPVQAAIDISTMAKNILQDSYTDTVNLVLQGLIIVAGYILTLVSWVKTWNWWKELRSPW